MHQMGCSDLGILAQVSDAHAMAFSFPHHATALGKKKKKNQDG